MYRLDIFPEEDIENSGVLLKCDAENLIMYRVLPCMVRMCKKEETTTNRIVAAETLAYLTEVCCLPLTFKYFTINHRQQ